MMLTAMVMVMVAMAMVVVDVVVLMTLRCNDAIMVTAAKI